MNELWPAAVSSLLAAEAIYVWWALRRPGRWRALGLLPPIVLGLCLPLLVPPSSIKLRFAVAVGGLIVIAKAVAFSVGRVEDPAMQRTFPRFLLWHTLPAESRWPRNPDEVRRARRDGLRRIGRGLAELALVAALCLSLPLAWIERHVWADIGWSGVFSGLALPGSVDLLTGLVMAAGLPVAEVFRLPLLADSPGDFWSRRWNLFYADWARRVLVLPLRRPLTAVALAFLLSALMHEHLVLVTLGYTRGTMSAFFVLQGAAVIVTILFRKRRRRRGLAPLSRPAAMVLQSLWMWLTLPLFFEPMQHILALHLSGSS